MSDTTRIKEIDADNLRALMELQPDTDFVLVDVREPDEYEQEHIPGARNQPVMEIEENPGSVRLARHTIFYCLGGKRGMRAATRALQVNPDATIYNLSGGIKAWRGEVLADRPALQVFEDASAPAEVLLRAMVLEKGAQRMYEEIQARLSHQELLPVVDGLRRAERNHARLLFDLLAEHYPGTTTEPFDALYDEAIRGDVLESGEPLEAAVARMEQFTSPDQEMFELALEMEFKAYDLYRNLAHRAEPDGLRTGLETLASQERRHARSLLSALGELARL